MAREDSYVAIHACGCMTAWCSDRAGAKDVAKFCADQIRRGLTVRRANTDALRDDPLFAPAECPHTPKGWEREKPKPYEPKTRCKTTSRHLHGKTISRVQVTTPWHHPFGMGDLVHLPAGWYYTDGWFDLDAPGITAHYGDAPADVFGPFAKRADVIAFITPRGMERSRAAWVSYDNHTEADADRQLAYAEGRF